MITETAFRARSTYKKYGRAGPHGTIFRPQPPWSKVLGEGLTPTGDKGLLAGLNLIGHGINVNAIAPGVVDGEHWDGVDALFAELENKNLGQKKQEVGAAVPFGRMGKAEDLAGMAIFLASKEADYIVAQTYNVDGGQWMS